MNVTIKGWPIDRFAEVAAWAATQYSLRPLIVGHVKEAALVNDTAAIIRHLGLNPAVWLGDEGELPILGALMAGARFYFGNDSAPMHLAAAVGTATVGIFGGGHWPRFLPVGCRSIGVGAPLPCFYCDWVCIFEDAPCVRLVTVEHITRAIDLVLSKDQEPHGNMLAVVDAVNPTMTDLVGKASHHWHQFRTELQMSRQIVDTLNNQLSALSVEHERVIGEIHKSLSWRITRLLRLLGRALRGK